MLTPLGYPPSTHTRTHTYLLKSILSFSGFLGGDLITWKNNYKTSRKNTSALGKFFLDLQQLREPVKVLTLNTSCAEPT